MNGAPRVVGLFRYPIKSCRGISCPDLVLDRRGAEGDRRWLVADPDGIMLTQRILPALARIVPAWTAGGLWLNAAGHPSQRVATDRQGDESRRRVDVTFHGTRFEGALFAATPIVDSWLSTVLGRPCQLLEMPLSARRFVSIGAGERPLSLVDQMPLHLVNAASVVALGGTEAPDLEAERFRPNLVVDGVPAWAEETWRGVTCAGVEMEVVKRVERCPITGVDPVRGIRSEIDPRRRMVRREGGGVPRFGLYLAHRGEAGRLALGATLTIRVQD